MDDPYRSSQTLGTCPRCGNTTENDGEVGRLVCTQGCGEWYPREAFDRVWRHVIAGGSAVPPQPWPWTPMSCPMCKTALQVGYREELRYDFCAVHGLWLDAGEYGRFATVFRLS